MHDINSTINVIPFFLMFLLFCVYSLDYSPLPSRKNPVDIKLDRNSVLTATGSHRIHTCFPFHRINRNLLSSDTLRFSMWSIFGNFYRYLFNRMSISFCVHTVNHYSVIVGKTHEKKYTGCCAVCSHTVFQNMISNILRAHRKSAGTPADFPLFSFFICETVLLLPSYPLNVPCKTG